MTDPKTAAERCGTCGHVGPRGNPHDCYWVFVERGRAAAQASTTPREGRDV